MHKLDDLRQLKRGLVERIGTKLEMRTARKWYNEGELSSKYFFNLLTRKANNEINCIVRDNGEELKKDVDIENEIRDFYKNLYEDVPDQLDSTDEFFRNVRPVSADEARTLERELDVEDLEKTLKTCSDSAPGPDGIPYSFLRHFWQSIGPLLVRSWSYSLETKQLPPSHKVSYLRLIPKAGKDCRKIANLRPITLSNTDHKLITKTYARRLTDIVAGSIGAEQTAYIPGRLINDNVRSMLATIDLANDDINVDGVLISLDAKKAFDSVDHRYIRRSLAAFGLRTFIPIFDTLYKDLSSDIIINGKTVKGYQILKGVKQGDALSCILFIICMEPLMLNIKQNLIIEPIVSLNLPIVIPKVYGYADDVTVATKRTEAGIQEIFCEYEEFSKNSGLVLNAEKTDVLCFNNARRSDHQFDVTYIGVSYHLQGLEQIKINGILFRQDPGTRVNENVAKVVAAMEKHLLAWSTRHLTLLGRILIIKTFAVSQAIYLMQSMSLDEVQCKLIMKTIYKFLWNRNFNGNRAPERLKRSIMLTPVSLGGFGLIDVRELRESLDLRSYGRLIKSTHPFFRQVKDLICFDNFFKVEITKAVDSKMSESLRLLNKERKKILSWPIEAVISNVTLVKLIQEMRLKTVLTRQGRQSLNYLILSRRVANAKIVDLTLAEFRGLENFVAYSGLGKIIIALLRVQRPNVEIDSSEAYPTKSLKIVNVSTLSSKALRQAINDDADKIICLYKIGMILDPGEVKAWSRSLKKLTSTRHKNILLRFVHGDIFSNSRLCKFRLRDTANCINCPEALETIQHRISECPKAVEAWSKLNEIKVKLGLNPTADLSVDNLVGAKERLNKIELALNAELILKLSTKSDGYCPKQVVKGAVRLIGALEPITVDLREKIKTILEQL